MKFWSGSYVKNYKLMITFFPNPDFSEFLICVINRSGMSFGQVANLLKFISHYMTALSVYMCLDFHPFDHDLMGPALQIMVIFEVS